MRLDALTPSHRDAYGQSWFADFGKKSNVNNPAGLGTVSEICKVEPDHADAKTGFAGATDAPSVVEFARSKRY